MACKSAARTRNQECAVCGATFRVSLAATVRRVSCSVACAAQLRLRRIVAVCNQCGQEFMVRPSEQGKKCYCSRQCSRAAVHERARTTPGYYHVTDEQGRSMQAHRAVMEQVLGRKLAAWEDVHHLDGDRKNNDPTNLEVLGRSEHLRRHTPQAQGRWAKAYEQCRECGGTTHRYYCNGYCTRCYAHRKYLAKSKLLKGH